LDNFKVHQIIDLEKHLPECARLDNDLKNPPNYKPLHTQKNPVYSYLVVVCEEKNYIYSHNIHPQLLLFMDYI
jgi:hypothetical protein